MAKYLKNFVTGHNISFESNKRNLAAFEKANELWGQIWNDHKPSGDSTILVSGAKNNGKSSLVRHLINTYNETHSSKKATSAKADAVETSHSKAEMEEDNGHDSETSELEMIDDNDGTSETSRKLDDKNVYAYLIDCDPGQSEMTCPGIISAHIIRATAPPLQRPAYQNIAQHETLVMSSVGGTNMSVNPRMYIENVRLIYNKVLEHRKAQPVKRPIFINTMGHIRNVGLAMLTDLIKICQPTSVIVLNVETDPMRTVYADLSAKAVNNTRASFYYETTNQQQQPQKRSDYKYDVRNLQFAFVDSSSVANKNRAASQLAYMATIPEAIYKPIMQLSAKWLSLKKVSVYCVSSYPLKEVIVLELLQHSWVHLVKLKKSSLQPADMPCDGESPSERGDADNNSSICKILEGVSENTLFGNGIVADIDLDQRLLAVITPVDQATLDESVDCIIKPLSIQVPHQMIQEGF